MYRPSEDSHSNFYKINSRNSSTRNKYKWYCIVCEEPRNNAYCFISNNDCVKLIRKKSVSKTKRERIFNRDSNECLNCKSNRNLTLDHIRPITKGGDYNDNNLQTLCSRCNGKKGNKIIDYRSAC